MKKFLLSFSALLCGAAAFAAVGDVVTLDGVTYKATSDTEAEISDVDTKLKKAFVIPETVEIAGVNCSVTSVGYEAFYWSNATSVELPNTVTSIQDKGFYSCDYLSSVKLGTGIKSLGRYAFGYAKVLNSISLPEGLESIGESAFSACYQLSEITFPSTLKTIGASCFYKCPFTKVQLPEGLEAIPSKLFLNCASLAEVNVPSTVKSIGDGAFYGTAIKSLELPAGLQAIGEEAFYNAPLTAMTIPAGVEAIGPTAFSGTKIAAFAVDADNKAFCAKDGVLYDADMTILYAFPPASTVTELTLPASVLGIYGGAFDRTNILKVTVGNKFRAIDGFAFCQSKLAEINMPASLVFIGEQAFAGTALTEVVLPASLPLIQEAAFAECKNLRSVTIPASVKYIGLRAFYNCNALTTINCQGMTPAELEDWYEEYESPFYNVPSSAVVNIPVGAQAAYKASLWNNAFSKFTESLPAAAVPTAIVPANDGEVAAFDGITLSFATDMSIVKSHPAITVVEGNLVAGVPVGKTIAVDEWYFTANSAKELRIWPADVDGYTTPFNMELNKEYYVTIPAGICKDAAGNLNEQMILHYSGTYEAPTVKILSISPADNQQISEIGTLAFTFAEKVNLQSSKLSDIKVMKGAVDGTLIPVEQWWAVGGKTSGTELSIFAGDEYDGYAMPITLEDHTDYYVILPAALFRLSSSYSAASDEIVLHYTNETGAVEILPVDDANAPAEYYNLNGIRVDNPANGIYIRRQAGKAVKVYVK